MGSNHRRRVPFTASDTFCVDLWLVFSDCRVVQILSYSDAGDLGASGRCLLRVGTSYMSWFLRDSRCLAVHRTGIGVEDGGLHGGRNFAQVVCFRGDRL